MEEVCGWCKIGCPIDPISQIGPIGLNGWPARFARLREPDCSLIGFHRPENVPRMATNCPGRGTVGKRPEKDD